MEEIAATKKVESRNIYEFITYSYDNYDEYIAHMEEMADQGWAYRARQPEVDKKYYAATYNRKIEITIDIAIMEADLISAKSEIDRLRTAINRIGFFCSGTESKAVSEFALRMLKGEQP